MKNKITFKVLTVIMAGFLATSLAKSGCARGLAMDEEETSEELASQDYLSDLGKGGSLVALQLLEKIQDEDLEERGEVEVSEKTATQKELSNLAVDGSLAPLSSKIGSGELGDGEESVKDNSNGGDNVKDGNDAGDTDEHGQYFRFHKHGPHRHGHGHGKHGHGHGGHGHGHGGHGHRHCGHRHRHGKHGHDSGRHIYVDIRVR
ncbi:MAG: hypothetical protein LBU15_04280 [Rickettsiales bacterium]|nr:hypothetical protein [Rickettsiales bacterium]